MEMCLVFWNESSSGSFEQSWGVSNFLFCGGGCSMSSGVEIVFPNLVFKGKIEFDVGDDHGWFFVGFAVLLVGTVVILFFLQCVRWVLSICVVREW